MLQPLALTAHVAWGDPVNHPWTTGIPQPKAPEGAGAAPSRGQ